MARAKFPGSSAQSSATIGFEAKPSLAPGETAAERESFGEVVLVGRLREAIRRLNPAISEEARATIRKFQIVRIEKRLNP